MHLKVHLSPLASGLSIDDTVELYCGNGEQILQWVGYASCSRLAYNRGEVYGRFVPQSITTKDGQNLDVDIVVNEILSDGDELYVEYSNGPQPYRVRWEGRPRSPPFKWGGEGEIVPSHDVWLMEVDLAKEGMLPLVDGDAHVDKPGRPEADLQEVKKLLIQFAAPMQMVFYAWSAEGASSGQQLGTITLPQFRGMMQQAKVMTLTFGSEKVDEIFSGVVTSEHTLARRLESKNGVSSLDLLDFLIAVVHVAYHRYAAEKPNATLQMLWIKVSALYSECIQPHMFPELSKKLNRFADAVSNASAQLLLRRANKLIEGTLDSCQLKRVRSATVKVDLRWLCTHLTRWQLLGRDFNVQELALIAIFAKQTTTSPEAFVLHPQPLEYNYSEFERLLLGMAHHIFVAKKKAGKFEEYLGEMLDMIFKKAGVLVDVAKDVMDE
ncbi:hypothetical protein FOA52_008082 [Chlamydomonas sp. UWO 241]|nr:hypothetical protein FOA52_008082 [Chlamydomonas sp. UWO 241]